MSPLYETPKVHWIKVANGRYRSEEELDGVPDFEIRRFNDRAAGGTQWRCKMRSSARARWFDSLTDAKVWAESI